MHLKIKNDGWLLLKIISPRKIAFFILKQNWFSKGAVGEGGVSGGIWGDNLNQDTADFMTF